MGKRKVKEVSRHAGHAGSGNGVAAAHTVERSAEEEVELVRGSGMVAISMSLKVSIDGWAPNSE